MQTMFRGRTRVAAFALLALTPFGSVALSDPPADFSSHIPGMLEQLSSPDYADRRKALKAAESYLAAQDAAWLNTPDGEAMEQVATALQFNRQLTSWLLELLKLPEEQKQEQVKLLTGSEMAPFLGQLFSEQPDQRVQGIHKLGTLHDGGIDLLLAHYLRDDEPAVALAAMEVVWDRPPSEETTTVLWGIGVGTKLENFLSPAPVRAPATQLTFRGRPLLARHIGYSAIVDRKAGAELDADAAVSVLAHLKAPQVEALLNQALHDVAEKLKLPDDSVNDTASYLRKQASWEVVNALASVGEGCGFKSTVPGFFALATMPVPKEKELGFFIAAGPAPAYYSIRTSALLTVLLLTDQHPADYGMLEGRERPIAWAAPSRGAEDQAVQKLEAWWKAKSADYAPAAR